MPESDAPCGIAERFNGLSGINGFVPKNRSALPVIHHHPNPHHHKLGCKHPASLHQSSDFASQSRCQCGAIISITMPVLNIVWNAVAVSVFRQTVVVCRDVMQADVDFWPDVSSPSFTWSMRVV